MAHICGLGYLLDRGHVNTTLMSIMKYNFRTSFMDHFNHLRSYALGEESGLIVATYPRGNRPTRPFPYCNEIWTGLEYTAAAGMAFEGMADKAMTVVAAVRARHDGQKRNPFDEPECGHHYARSMASWALLTALSGFECDLTENRVSFDPKINKDDFQCFFSTGRQWGVYRQKKLESGEIARETEVLYEVK
jgi:uncharacterized protein (DUF608 family)